MDSYDTKCYIVKGLTKVNVRVQDNEVWELGFLGGFLKVCWRDRKIGREPVGCWWRVSLATRLIWCRIPPSPWSNPPLLHTMDFVEQSFSFSTFILELYILGIMYINSKLKTQKMDYSKVTLFYEWVAIQVF